MKKNLKFFAGALTTAIILGGGILASCTSEEGNGLFAGSNVISLAKAPNVVAYSGDMVFGNTFANKGIATRANQDAPFWNGTENVKPADVTEAERDYVVQYFHEHQGKTDAVTVDFKNFYVQQVYYDDGPFVDGNGTEYTGRDCVVEIEVRDAESKNKLDNVFSGNDNFNKCRYLYNSSSLDFWYNNSKCSYWSNNFKMVYIPGYGYYVGFDVEGLPDDEYPANRNMHMTGTPDGWYYDRIIKIVPADEKGNPLPLPNTSGCGCKDCPDCDGDCEDCQCGKHSGNGGNDNGDYVWNYEPRNEVEVNLSVNEPTKDDLLASHLSIHVRYATDVEVWLPIPKEYYCDKDDMAIVQKHEEELTVHGGPTEIKYVIANQTVTLSVSFEDNGIRITTNGINEEVIEYLWSTNKDGITFEIWNYFNEGVTQEQVRNLLNTGDINGNGNNGSKINFLDNAPDYYVNAFEKERDKVYGDDGKATGGKVVQDVKDEVIFSWDCTVTPVDETLFKAPTVGEWLNGSPFNQIYENKDHTTTPSEE